MSPEVAAWLARLNNLARSSAGRILACRPDGSAAAIYAADRAPSGEGWVRWTIVDADIDAAALLVTLSGDGEKAELS